ncbi:MAG: hypothetical protein Q8P18_32395 [Pseudomonadota bacterium]|nr:hypothetical protein [Pseudomonadota bacterium]
MRLTLLPTSLLPSSLILLLPLAACESVESKDTLTDGIYADYAAVTEGNGITRAQATLRVGGGTSNTFVELVGDDVLTVTAGGITETLLSANIGDYFTYLADLDVDAADTSFAFAFTRTVDAGAPQSTVSLPSPFTLTGPAADTVFSRATDPIVVTWGDAGSTDALQVKLTGDCIFDHLVSVDGDPGTVTIEAGTLLPTNEETPEACAVSLVVQRRRDGTLDAGFGEGGVVYAAQTRAVGIRSDP